MILSRRSVDHATKRFVCTLLFPDALCLQLCMTSKTVPPRAGQNLRKKVRSVVFTVNRLVFFFTVARFDLSNKFVKHSLITQVPPWKHAWKPLTRAGRPRMRGGQYRGTALRDARRNKERTYPEPLRDRRCRLVVFRIEVGGRWSDEAATFLRLLAHTKDRQARALLRHSLTNALIHRWSAMLTHAAMHAFAASLLDQDLSGCHYLEGNTPSISEIPHQSTIFHFQFWKIIFVNGAV